MRLTRAGEYAIRCMLYLAKKGTGVLVSRKEIAAQSQIPAHFLAKIAQQLAKAGLIDIRQGARGGFLLRKNAGDISLLDVVETMIGEIYLNDCIARPDSCSAREQCAVHRIWLSARDEIRATLRAASLASLIQEELCVPPLDMKNIIQLPQNPTANKQRGD